LFYLQKKINRNKLLYFQIKVEIYFVNLIYYILFFLLNFDIFAYCLFVFLLIKSVVKIVFYIIKKDSNLSIKLFVYNNIFIYRYNNNCKLYTIIFFYYLIKIVFKIDFELVNYIFNFCNLIN